MFAICKIFNPASGGMPSFSTTTRLFKAKERGRKEEKVKVKERKKENEILQELFATAARLAPDSLFIAGLGTLLKEGRYKVIRKLDQGLRSNTFLVEDLQFSYVFLTMTLLCRLTFSISISELRPKYLAAKIFSADATKANDYIQELQILLRVLEHQVGRPAQPLLPILCDHFAQPGLHGLHYFFLTRSFRTDVDAFRASAPTGKLGVHIVKPIVACTLEALQRLHSHDIIHTDIKANNLLFLGPSPAQTEEIMKRDPPLYNGVCTVNETIQVVLSGLGAALCADLDKPSPPGNIRTFALRAPENIVRVQCGKEVDIWAIGCMTYELLTGQSLFRPLAIPSLTSDESLLLLQFAVTGETLSKDIIDQSPVRDRFFDPEGIFIHSKENIYPPRSIKKRLGKLCKDDLTKIQINAAAKFINDCLRLNPHDRPTADQLYMHPWLSTAFSGGEDNEDQLANGNGNVRMPLLPMSTVQEK
ncbi:hypothetical protein Clacol_009066 [Clathrus columnatus]|uniref:non-specific serine/threonine protein kinase n=1 Tax=Clathrus columnatus TaxID=1419009 RepID=A0AAV5AP14_9AGAM|nr:hypothetical protein Clacol_009066 [Clathrus columnatus]